MSGIGGAGVRVFGGDLPDTPTYKARSWELLLPDRPGELEDGALTIRQTCGRKAEADTYQVQAVSLGRPVVVQLLSVTDPDQPDVYEVAVGLSVRCCSCKAGQCLRRCKHIEAVAAAVRAGAFALMAARPKTTRAVS